MATYKPYGKTNPTYLRNASGYSPYSDAIEVYNAKVAWNNATTPLEKQAQSKRAETARKRLEANGYDYIAKQLSADGATVADVEGFLGSILPSEWNDKIIKNANKQDTTIKWGKTASPTTSPTTSPTASPTTSPTTTNGGAKTGSEYDPYTDVQTVYNAKVAWNNATTDEERKRQNEIANAARQRLADYGYEDLATRIGADEATATTTRKILDSYAPPSNTTYSTNTLDTGIDNDAYNNRIASASTKNDVAFTTIRNDHADLNAKYNGLYNYANSDITQTDEYKSAFKNIMPGYSLAAMQGRDNAVASGGASNGGNIDSYASANAMRQQAALTAKGQALAHQIGLESANARINNVNTILKNLGVYNTSVYDAMNENIKNDLTLANDITKNEQDARNYETARLLEEAAVTGYTPSEWVIKNDDVYSTYLNEDGTFKKEMEHIDIQALINDAKAKGDTETANKLAVVRTKKMLGNWGEFGQYANEGDTGYMKPQITEGRRQAEEENKLAYYDIDTTKFIQQYLADIGLAGTKYAADIEKYIQTYISDNNLKGTIHTADIELAINKYISDNNLKGIIETNKTTKEINTDNNTTTVKLAETGGNTEYDLDDIVKMLKNTKTPSQELIDAYNKLSGDATKYTVDNPPPMTGENVGGIPDPEAEWTEFTSEFTDEKILKFINEKLRPYFDNNWEINEETLEKLIVGSNPLESNSTDYDIDVEEAKAICKALGLDDSWVDKYKNRWGWNKGKGMKLA